MGERNYLWKLNTLYHSLLRSQGIAAPLLYFPCYWYKLKTYNWFLEGRKTLWSVCRRIPQSNNKTHHNFTSPLFHLKKDNKGKNSYAIIWHKYNPPISNAFHIKLNLLQLLHFNIGCTLTLDSTNWHSIYYQV